MRREIHNLSTSMISHHSSLRGFTQFWSHYKSPLVIQTLKGYEDIDTFSIEMVKEHDKTRVVLPSLAKKVHLQKKSFYAVSTSASIFFILYVKPIRSLLIQRTPAGSSFRLFA